MIDFFRCPVGSYCQFMSAHSSKCVPSKTCSPATNWDYCSQEGGTCTCAGAVRYWYNDLTKAEIVSGADFGGEVICDHDGDGAFETDPRAGRNKKCECCSGPDCPAQPNAFSINDTSLCAGLGDPHYQTFDLKRYKLNDHCQHRLVAIGAPEDCAIHPAGTTTTTTTITTTTTTATTTTVAGVNSSWSNAHAGGWCPDHFEIQVRHAPRAGSSLITGVSTCVPNLGRIEFYQGVDTSRAYRFNGTYIPSLPATLDGHDGAVSLTVLPHQAGGAKFEVHNGTTLVAAVIWNGYYSLQVYMNNVYSQSNTVCGLCGDFDGDGNETETDVVEQYNYWAVGNSTGIRSIFTDPHEHACVPGGGPSGDSEHGGCEDAEGKEAAERWCAVFVDKSGPLGACHDYVDPQEYYDYCVSDVCSGGTGVGCMTLYFYADMCQAAGIPTSLSTIAGINQYSLCSGGKDQWGDGDSGGGGNTGGTNGTSSGGGGNNGGGDGTPGGGGGTPGGGGGDDEWADDDWGDIDTGCDPGCYDACMYCDHGVGKYRNTSLKRIHLEYVGAASPVRVQFHGTTTQMSLTPPDFEEHNIGTGARVSLLVYSNEFWDRILKIWVIPVEIGSATLDAADVEQATTTHIQTDCQAPIRVGEVFGVWKIVKHENTDSCKSDSWSTTSSTTSISTATSTSTVTITSTTTLTTYTTTTTATTSTVTVTTTTTATTSTTTRTTTTTTTTTTTVTATTSTTTVTTTTTTVTTTTTTATTTTKTSTTTTTATTTTITSTTTATNTTTTTIDDLGGVDNGGDPGGSATTTDPLSGIVTGGDKPGDRDDDEFSGILFGGDAGDPRTAVKVDLIIDDQDYATLFPDEANDVDKLVAIFQESVRLVSKPSSIATYNITLRQGSVLLTVYVQAKDVYRFGSYFAKCAFCFAYNTQTLCPRLPTAVCNAGADNSIVTKGAEAASDGEDGGDTLMIIIALLLVVVLVAMVLVIAVMKKKASQNDVDSRDEPEAMNPAFLAQDQNGGRGAHDLEELYAEPTDPAKQSGPADVSTYAVPGPGQERDPGGDQGVYAEPGAGGTAQDASYLTPSGHTDAMYTTATEDSGGIGEDIYTEATEAGGKPTQYAANGMATYAQADNTLAPAMQQAVYATADDSTGGAMGVQQPLYDDANAAQAGAGSATSDYAIAANNNPVANYAIADQVGGGAGPMYATASQAAAAETENEYSIAVQQLNAGTPSLQLSPDGASIRLKSARRTNPLYAQAQMLPRSSEPEIMMQQTYDVADGSQVAPLPEPVGVRTLSYHDATQGAAGAGLEADSAQDAATQDAYLDIEKTL